MSAMSDPVGEGLSWVQNNLLFKKRNCGFPIPCMMFIKEICMAKDAQGWLNGLDSASIERLRFIAHYQIEGTKYLSAKDIQDCKYQKLGFFTSAGFLEEGIKNGVLERNGEKAEYHINPVKLDDVVAFLEGK